MKLRSNLEVDKFVNYLVSNIPNEKEIIRNFLSHEITDYLENILDPRYKFVINAYDQNNEVFSKQFIDSKNLDSETFRGYSFNKIKLQIRLENQNDLSDLSKFLDHINNTLTKISEEQQINNNRSGILEEILDETKETKWKKELNLNWQTVNKL